MHLTTSHIQVKNTPWEGGVRAAGLVWSPLIPSPRRGQVMSNLMDISDWLPTLYEAGGSTPVLFCRNHDSIDPGFPIQAAMRRL